MRRLVLWDAKGREGKSGLWIVDCGLWSTDGPPCSNDCSNSISYSISISEFKSEFKRRRGTDYTLVDGFGSEHGSGSYGRLNFSGFETIRNGKDASSFVRNAMFGAWWFFASSVWVGDRGEGMTGWRLGAVGDEIIWDDMAVRLRFFMDSNSWVARRCGNSN